MQLLDIVQRVWKRLPLNNIPGTVVGNTDPQVSQMLEIVQMVGEDLMSRHEWQILYRVQQFTTVSSPFSFPIPEDWNRYRQDASVWSSASYLVPLDGPCSDDVWHLLLSTPGIRFPGYWRLADQNIDVIGSPNGGDISFNYSSSHYVIGTDLVRKAFFTADTDSPLFPDILIRLGCIWQWKQSKGLDYAEDMRTFELQLERSIAADRATKPVTTRRYLTPDSPPYTWPGQVVVPP